MDARQIFQDTTDDYALHLLDIGRNVRVKDDPADMLYWV